MADDDVENRSPPSSSHPFFVRGGFPFVFLPTTLTTDLNFANNRTHVSTTDDRPTKEENDENSEEVEIEEEGADRNDDSTTEKDDLRISQPKYSQLLKELDFSHTRMVDVTNLLPNELDQPGDYLTPDENENPKKTTTDGIKYESSSSSTGGSASSNEPLQRLISTDKKAKQYKNAANEIENDLNDLAAVIQAASQLSTDKNDEEEENSEHSNNNNIQKRHIFDEDDDTSKQATQNYDLHDNEQEDIIPSSKSSKIPRLINQRSNNMPNENKSFISNASTNKHNQATKHKEEEEEQQQPPPPISWDDLLFGNDQVIQPLSGLIFTEPINQSHFTPKKPQQTFVSSGEKSKPITKQNIHHQSGQVASTSSSSPDTDSVVEHTLHRSKQKQPSPKQPTPPRIPPQTIRQDSQATLIDENLDDLSSQIKQGLLDQERQTLNTSTKEERTTDGLGSMSFPLSTPDILSTDILENNILNRPNENLLRHSSSQQRNKYSSNIPERSNPQRKKSHHHHHHHSASRHMERNDKTSPRKTDDNWLTMLEKLEREHKTRLEKQQQQYETYMHTLEDKMKRRFDDYLTLTNGFQESRLDNNHGETVHAHRVHTSIPIDSNIGRYKTHSYQPLAKDLVSHYYPADSTLNVLTTEKKRSTVTNNIPRSQSRDDVMNLHTELSAKHAKHIADLKLHYEYEINELRSQLNRTRMGHTSSSTRQSLDTIERINNENIRLHDEVNELRHSLKMTAEENVLLKRQLEELRDQLNNKDLDLKNYHRTISDLEQQLTEAENTKERHDEKFRHTDRQVFFYQEENEKLKTDLNLTRERLLRLEERHQVQENENETLRRQLFLLENDNNRIKNRMTDDHNLSSTMPLNMATSREYGGFTLSTARHSTSTTSTPRDGNIDSTRYQPNGSENLNRHAHSSRPITRISDYLSERPTFPQPYVPPARHLYSPRKSSPNRRRVEPVSMRMNSSVDRQMRQSEQLEQKFDQLLKKKRDLETRLNRIPIRGLTSTDRQLHDVLEREIERVEQQISSVKLELRKLNIFRTH